MAEIVPATMEMIRAVTDDPLPRTVRAIAAVEGERVLGVTGFYAENGGLVIFSGFADQTRAEIDRHKRTLILCARKIMSMAREKGMPIYAICDSSIPKAAVLLRHLGFSHVYRETYQWHG
jgi:hypothetical protein